MQASHRKMKRWQILWAVRDWAHRWLMLEHRRRARREDYRQVLDKLHADEDRLAVVLCLDLLDEASSMEVMR